MDFTKLVLHGNKILTVVTFCVALIFYLGIYFTGTNTLTGTIPTEIGLLTNLTKLVLSKSFIKLILYYDSI